MKKNFLQDVVPPENKRSIRDIPLPNSKQVNNKIESETEVSPEIRSSKKEVVSDMRPPIDKEVVFNEVPTDEEIDKEKSYPPVSTPPRMQKKSHGFKFGKIGIISSVVLVVILIFTFMSIFSGATVKVTPRQAEAVINETLQISSSNEDSVDITYKTVDISIDIDKTIKATGEEEVSTKASGIITIYNDYSDSEQPLVKNTRFESEDGLIYRIDKSVNVPGKTSSGPGTLDVEIFADSTGDEYNKTSASFTIPGFADLPQFDGFSAKTKTEISGGFEGVRPVVSEDDLQKATTEMRENLASQLKERVDSEINENMIALYDDQSISFSNPKQEQSGQDVKILITGTLSSLVFNEGDFSNTLASESLTIFNQSDNVTIENPSDLEITILRPGEDEEGSESIQVTGKAKFIWDTNSDLLKQTIAGTSRKDLKTILQDFNGIAKAEASIRPFWKTIFPEDTEKIDIEIELEK